MRSQFLGNVRAMAGASAATRHAKHSKVLPLFNKEGLTIVTNSVKTFTKPAILEKKDYSCRRMPADS